MNALLYTIKMLKLTTLSSKGLSEKMQNREKLPSKKPIWAKE
jgi:hypothetical protein